MKNDKKGFISVVLFFLIIAVCLAVMPIIMSTRSYQAIDEPEKAFYIAESGIKYYAQHDLKSDTDWTNNAGIGPINFGGGRFTVAVIGPAPREKERIIVRSTGTVTIGTQNFNRVIERTITTGLDCFDGAMYGEGPISIDHNGTINGDIVSSGTVTIDHSDWTVNGDILENQTHVDIPSVNWAYWQGMAGANVITPPTGTHEFTASSYNGVYYVNGNVTISKNNINFQGTIVATGDISITGNGATYQAATGNPAFISGNNFLAQNVNNIQITGAIYAANNLTINIIAAQGGTITGSLVFGGICTINQANNSTFNIDPNASSAGFTGGAGGTKLSNYREL